MNEGTHERARIAEVIERGGVKKLRLLLADGACVEAVVLPGDGRGPTTPPSLCVSTQVGCRMGCAFCATGRMGFVRDLAPEEIVAQVRAAAALGPAPGNLVFMGMGEPLDNFDGWREAVRMLIDSRRRGSARPAALGSTRRMTVSTCGHLDGMARFARAGFHRMGFAVSLNAPNDEIRSALMPVNRRWPMADLRAALLDLPLRNGVLLVEYVLIRGVNDAPDHARQLAQYLKPLRPLVNLLTCNPIAEGGTAGLEATEEATVAAFQRTLADLGVFVTRREPRGLELAAACGQLACRPGSG